MLGIDQRAEANDSAQVISYRLTNLLLHLLCGALLFGVIRRTLRSPRLAENWAAAGNRIAGLTTAIWLLHPIQSEAVNYVIQRTELLVSACWLTTMYAWIRVWDATNPRRAELWRAAAVVSCLLGMGSKEVMIAAPIVVVLYDRVFHAASWGELVHSRRRLWSYGLLAATSLWLVWNVVTGPRSDSVGFDLGMSWYRYLYSQAWAIGHYVRLVFWPHPLSIDYGKDPISGLRPIPGLLLLLAAGVTTVWAWMRIERRGWLAFYGAWFFLLLAPSSSFVPIITEIAAERRIYLALAAPLVALVAGGAMLLAKLTRGTRSRRRLSVQVGRFGTLAAMSLCLLLAALTFNRSVAYARPEALWRQDITTWPRNARGFNNLGQVLGEQPSRSAEAESAFDEAIAIDSNMTTAWIDLAYLKTKQGRLPDAEAALHHAMRIYDRTNHRVVVERYGRVLLGMGEVQRAIPLLERAVASHPTDENLFWLGAGYLEGGRPNDAVAPLRRCLSLNPDFTVALRYLGRALIESGRAADAVTYLQAAAVREPRSAIDFALLSLAFASIGRAQDALDAAGVAAKIGNNADAFVYAGTAMTRLHRAKDAQQFFSSAVSLHPDDYVTLTLLGVVDVELGDGATAAGLFRRALAINRDYGPAREALADLERRRRD